MLQANPGPRRKSLRRMDMARPDPLFLRFLPGRSPEYCAEFPMNLASRPVSGDDCETDDTAGSRRQMSGLAPN